MDKKVYVKAKLMLGNRHIKDISVTRPIPESLTTFVDREGKRKIGNEIVTFKLESEQGAIAIYRGS